MKVKTQNLEGRFRSDVIENRQWISELSDHNNPRKGEDSRFAHRIMMQEIFEALSGKETVVRSVQGMH